jgi:hypothetical protein
MKNPGTKFEEWVVEVLRKFYADAKRTKASGAVHEECDVRAGPFDIECKDNPNQKSVSISSTTLRKIRKSAGLRGRKAAVFNRMNEGIWVTLEITDFAQLLKEATGATV